MKVSEEAKKTQIPAVGRYKLDPGLKAPLFIKSSFNLTKKELAVKLEPDFLELAPPYTAGSPLSAFQLTGRSVLVVHLGDSDAIALPVGNALAAVGGKVLIADEEAGVAGACVK